MYIHIYIYIIYMTTVCSCPVEVRAWKKDCCSPGSCTTTCATKTPEVDLTQDLAGYMDITEQAFSPVDGAEKMSKAITVTVSASLIEQFKLRAADNSRNNKETLGFIYGYQQKNKRWLANVLFLPEQGGKDDCCWETKAERDGVLQANLEIAGFRRLGWIHTHPGFDCFMSSQDLHTQEYIEQHNPVGFGIVVSYRNNKRGELRVYRLTSKGQEVISKCTKGHATGGQLPEEDAGLHEHNEPKSLYEEAKHVDIGSKRKATVLDSRCKEDDVSHKLNEAIKKAVEENFGDGSGSNGSPLEKALQAFGLALKASLRMSSHCVVEVQIWLRQKS